MPFMGVFYLYLYTKLLETCLERYYLSFFIASYYSLKSVYVKVFFDLFWGTRWGVNASHIFSSHINVTISRR